MYKCVERYTETVDDINETLALIESKFNIDIENRMEVLDGMLYTRVRDGYASTLKLIVNDFHLEASILERTTTEAFFVFASHIINEEKTYDYLVAQDKFNKRKIINNTLKYKKYQTHLEPAQNFDMSKLEGAKDIKAYEWAELANEEQHYEYTYSLLSDNVHVNLDSLEKRLDTDGDKIVGFKQTQGDDFLNTIIVSIIDIMLKSLNHLNSRYSLMDNAIIENIQKRFEKLANK